MAKAAIPLGTTLIFSLQNKQVTLGPGLPPHSPDDETGLGHGPTRAELIFSLQNKQVPTRHLELLAELPTNSNLSLQNTQVSPRSRHGRPGAARHLELSTDSLTFLSKSRRFHPGPAMGGWGQLDTWSCCPRNPDSSWTLRQPGLPSLAITIISSVQRPI